MTRKLIRHYGRGHLRFVTFTCYGRLALLRPARARTLFVQILGEVRERFGFSRDFQKGHAALPRFWQRRFYDFNARSLKKRVEKLHSMHMNTLKRKLVNHPKDWPWSSFSYDSKSGGGLIRVDPVR